jgi:hypothetical protein
MRGVGWFVSFMFEDIIEPWRDPKPLLPEDRIPRDKMGKPDLSFYTDPLQHYIDLYNSFLNTQWRGLKHGQRALAWKQRVHGTWGLSVKGEEALPFLLTLIRHPNPDAREDGYFLLGELKSNAGISEQLFVCLQNEKDLVAKSAVIDALGKCRYRPAIPALANLILDKEVDIDTRWNAADSLGSILGDDFAGDDFAGDDFAGENFAGRDKLEKAEAWLAAHEW